MEKYLIVIHQYLPKWYTGTEQLANRFSSYCKNNFLNIEILTFEPNTLIGKLCKLLNLHFFYSRKINGIKVNYLEGENNNFNFKIDNRKYKKFLNKTQPKKIIFFHTMRNSELIFESIKRGIPYSLVLTDYFIACPHYTLIDKKGEICLDNKAGKKCSDVCNYQLESIKDRHAKSEYILKNSEQIFISSNYFKSLITKHIDIDLDKIKIIDYGSSIKNLKTVEKNTIFTIGYCGTFSDQKGLMELIDYIENTKENIRFIFLGSGPLHDKLKKLSKKNKNVILQNPVDITRLREKINLLDVAILPSKWPENNPTIINEYLNSGKPVIVSNVGSLPFQIEHKKSGYVLEDLSNNSFDKAIKYCRENINCLAKFSILKQDIHEDIMTNALMKYLKE